MYVVWTKILNFETLAYEPISDRGRWGEPYGRNELEATTCIM